MSLWRFSPLLLSSPLFLPLWVMKKRSLGISGSYQMLICVKGDGDKKMPASVALCARRTLRRSTSEHLAYVPMIGWGSSSGYNTWKCLGMFATTAVQRVCVCVCVKWLYLWCMSWGMIVLNVRENYVWVDLRWLCSGLVCKIAIFGSFNFPPLAPNPFLSRRLILPLITI